MQANIKSKCNQVGFQQINQFLQELSQDEITLLLNIIDRLSVFSKKDKQQQILSRKDEVILCDKQTISKFFNSLGIHCRLFRFTKRSLCEATSLEQAMATVKIMSHFFKDTSECTIVEARAGIGGNTQAFISAFKILHIIEYDISTFAMLKNNLNILLAEREQYLKKFHTLKKTQYIPYMPTIHLYNKNILTILPLIVKKQSIDVIFFDPPWGGIQYKYQNSVNLVYQTQFKEVDLSQLIILIKNYIKLIVIKAPYNLNHTFMKTMRQHFTYTKIINFAPVYNIICLSHTPPYHNYPQSLPVHRIGYKSITYKNAIDVYPNECEYPFLDRLDIQKKD